MTINELMHNDLFMYGGSLCRFVIRSMDAIVQRLSDKSEYKPCAVLNAEPIPLTAEMLEGNGFEYEYESSSWAVCELYLLHGHKADWDIMVDCVNIPIKYVHELQHALRLCGLIELADNFVIR